MYLNLVQPSTTESCFNCFPPSESRCSLQASEEDQVLLYCLQPRQAAIKKSHAVVQTCFSELCLSAVSTICQVREEY